MRKVLFAEDDGDIAKILRLCLCRDKSISVVECADGATVEARALEFMPDLILLDVSMPIVTGPEAFAILKQNEQLKDIPVVFLTAKAMRSELESLLSLGAAGVIIKPFNPIELPEQLKMYWKFCHV
jgi:CheY-like chemotaxis protein